MTDEPMAVVHTPKRRFVLKRPSKTTLRKAATLTGVAALSAVVTARAVKRECACENDTAETADQTSN